MTDTNEIHLARIESAEFGKIVVDGKEYNKDIIITGNGNVIYRPGYAEEKYGTHHIICMEEIKLMLRDYPRVIIIGTGQYGACRFEKGVKEEIEKQEVKLLVEKTPKAIHLFNNVNERKAGLFHLTC
jgi:hypothetical protein